MNLAHYRTLSTPCDYLPPGSTECQTCPAGVSCSGVSSSLALSVCSGFLDYSNLLGTQDINDIFYKLIYDSL